MKPASLALIATLSVVFAGSRPSEEVRERISVLIQSGNDGLALSNIIRSKQGPQAQAVNKAALGSYASAISMTMKAYGIESSVPGRQVAWGPASGEPLRFEPEFRENLSGTMKLKNGHAIAVKLKKDSIATTWQDGSVFLDKRAFRSPDVLASILVHELSHHEDLCDPELENLVDRELRAHIRDIAFYDRFGLEGVTRASSIISLREYISRKFELIQAREDRLALVSFSRWVSSIQTWLTTAAPPPSQIEPPRDTLEPPSLRKSPLAAPFLAPNSRPKNPEFGGLAPDRPPQGKFEGDSSGRGKNIRLTETPTSSPMPDPSGGPQDATRLSDDRADPKNSKAHGQLKGGQMPR